MKRVLALSLLIAGCAESPVTQPVRSLEQNGEVSFFCASVGSGRPVAANIDECPDRVTGQHHLFALVTQTLRGEVALIDLDRGDEGEVVDVNPSVPGFSFLPVGEQPVDIVSSPGGTASFVAVAAPGRAGIFALPTSCISAPRADEPARDLTTWPACALPAAPRDMSILLQPAESDASSCGVAATQPARAPEEVACPADVNGEGGTGGIRKLAVTLPERGTLAIIDAQWLLNQEPGSFNDCQFVEHALAVDLPSTPVEQELPPDLLRPATCVAPPLPPGPVGASFSAFPVKQALGGSSLYIADLHAPLIHRLNVSDPCKATPEPALLPKSVDDPGRLITVRDLAVSPETTRGERFVYAIEGEGSGGVQSEERGGIMVFDVTPGRTNRTPLVRAGSPRTPFEPPDRILFSAPARAVSFAKRDIPEVDPVTGGVTYGEFCNPDPSIGEDSTAARYRTAPDLSRGAGPRKLRGIFAFAALSSGQVAVIDVEDFDALCRRPVSANVSSEPDFRGCANDPSDNDYALSDGAATVSNEASCNVVEPHRARGANYVLTSNRNGLRAPALRALPRLGSPQGGLVTDNTFEGRINPKLLAVDFQPTSTSGRQMAQVFVGTSLYSADSALGQSTEEFLDLSPATADRNSLVLPLIEPRSYAAQEDFAVVYEGQVTRDWQGGRWAPKQQATEPTLTLLHSANFCDDGVEDMTLIRDHGVRLQVAEANLDAFARRHGDYVQIRTKLQDSDDRYWSEVGPSCAADAGLPEFGYDVCLKAFGPHDAENLDATRDLRIVEAYQSQLVLEPRQELSPEERTRRFEMLRCCFPQSLTYTVRAGHHWLVRGSASGFRHDVRAQDGDFRCVRDCNPKLVHNRSRVWEISSREVCGSLTPDTDDAQGCIGPATSDDYVCTVAGRTTAVQPNGEASQCIFENLTARFAIYRGHNPTTPADSESRRDMVFAWQTVGGFTPLAANIVEETSSTSPRSMTFVPQLNQLAVVDGRLAGLTFISLSSMSVSRSFF
ncbi:MAG TPA: hypothetical protein VK524_11325 [Polyangiaceae bacterium]|nr:hypothetical protein [Polyangiaceae bacterium]